MQKDIAPSLRLPAAAVLVAALASCSSAWAGRPLVTEDAGVLARGECEWESFAGRQSRPKVTLVATQAGCGAGGNTQLAVGAAHGGPSQDRSTSMLVSGKTAFSASDEAAPQLAMAYSLFGGREPGDTLNYTGAEIKGVATLAHAGWRWHANAGLLLSHQEREQRVIWAMAAERPAAIGALDLMGEIHGDDRSRPWVQVAVRWSALPGRLFLDASYGIHTNSRRARLATVGMKLAF